MCVAAAIAGGAIVGGVLQSNAAGKAADAQTNAANQANATQLQIYNSQRQDQAPWRQAGTQALGALSQFYGLGGVQQNNPSRPPPGSGTKYSEGIDRAIGANGQPLQTQEQKPYDFNSILQNLPGYQFQLQQGQQAAQRNLASRGLLNSGAALKSLDQYGQGLASSYADKYANGLQSLAGIGQTANAQSAQAGQNYANQVGSNLGYGANAQAAGYANQANAWGGALNQIGAGIGNYYGNNYSSYNGLSNASNSSIYNTGQDPSYIPNIGPGQ